MVCFTGWKSCQFIRLHVFEEGLYVCRLFIKDTLTDECRVRASIDRGRLVWYHNTALSLLWSIYATAISVYILYTSLLSRFIFRVDRRAYFLSCLSFCNSVHSETLILLIIFEQWVLELWYFIWIFPVIRPFRGYPYFFTPSPWPWILTHFLKTYTLLIIL